MFGYYTIPGCYYKFRRYNATQMNFRVDLFPEQRDLCFPTPIFARIPQSPDDLACLVFRSTVFASLMHCVLSSETPTIALDTSRLHQKADFIPSDACPSAPRPFPYSL